MYSSCRGVTSEAKSATVCITSLPAKIILVDINLAVSTLIIKLSNLIFRQIYRLYGILYYTNTSLS